MRTLNRLLLAGLFATVPLAVMAADDTPSADPDVTIRTEGDKTIQEYRQNGFLYAIKVTPKGAPPYFLVRVNQSEGNFVESEKSDMRIPGWKIFEWK
ncbi:MULTISPECIES: DUF2782 domain-containing protein [Pseudomonas]|jgi:hypothetical protein|uniref:DUF2782 domain-containing protein n=1 Tax=Pseudomonas fluorescens TaxID=294 RepID=A0A5E7WJR0_PSEFL|nr:MULTISPECIES: DUF2782 domain-containing protein [Pseudomonas]VVQ34887.1 hypothetical protein PS943_04079 [Pseudomonas fluorescens]